MNTPFCQLPLEWDTLLAYGLGELDPDSEARIEEHYLGCASCSRRLEQLRALGRMVCTMMQSSGVTMVVNDQFVRRLSKNGLHVREYLVPLNGSVNCTVMPEDDFIVARLEAPLADVKRIDMVHVDSQGTYVTRQEDIPFVADSGGVLYSTRIDTLRALPAISMHLRLLAVDHDGERTLGEYRFNHTPYTGPAT